MAKEVPINSDKLSYEGYSNLAAKSPDNKLDASRIDTPAARQELQRLKTAIEDKTSKIEWVTSAELSQLLDEVSKGESDQAGQRDWWVWEDADSWGERDWWNDKESKIPADIKKAADKVRISINSKFGSKEYLSVINMVLGKIPWYEVSSPNDAKDILYASRTWALDFVDWLEQESGKNTSNLNTWWTNKSGRWSFWSERTEFDWSVEAKRKHILEMLQALDTALDDPKNQAWIIETYTEKLIKGAVLTAAWTAWALFVGWILVFVWTKWVLKRALWHTGELVASAIGSVAWKWVWLVQSWATEAVNRGKASGLVRWAVKGAAAWLAIDLMTPIPTGVGTTVGAIAWWVRWARSAAPATLWAVPAQAPWVQPAATPWAVPARAPDIEGNRLDKAVSSDILHALYNAEQIAAGGAPIPNDKPLPWDWNKPELLSISNTTAYAQYTQRMKEYIALGDRPVEPAKLRVWQQKLGGIVLGQTKEPWLFARGADKADWRAGEATRLSAWQAAHRSAVAEAHVASFSIWGATFDVSGDAETKLIELQAQEIKHGKTERELKDLITERTRLEWIKNQLMKRQKAEVAIEQLAIEIGEIDDKIKKIKDPATGWGTLKIAEDDLRTKNQTLNRHRASFKYTKWPLTGQPNDAAFQADSQTPVFTQEAEAAQREVDKLKTSLTKLEWELGTAQTNQRDNTRAYRTEYSEAPRPSARTIEKLKWNWTPWSLPKHVEGILDKIAANDAAQGAKVKEMKDIWIDVKRIGSEIEATPKMLWKLNALKVSDVSVKTKIAGVDVEIPSLKGMTEKIARVAQDVFKKGVTH